ncbi:hypothetical protein F4779DRAFT_598155 [Xylariaceae sp. FL0662B]|nr:hypothetical protein F4779DRAFT_598155 [Xylariaceae sp. FL0662B]
MTDRLALTSPGSSDVATMEGHPQPSEMPVGFARSQDLAALEHMDINLPFSTSRHQADSSYGARPLHNRLALWYQRNDGPWIPQGLTSPQDDIRNPSVLGNIRANPFVFPGQYRESVVPSECDTIPPGVIPSDSGYGSFGAKQSVANGSVCDEPFDRSTETQSLVGHISDLNFQSFPHEMMPKSGINPRNSYSQSQAPPPPPPSSFIDGQIQLEGGNLMCETCGKLVKTNSELKKHKHRHSKPFKCEVKNCTRQEGFSTPNDLDRHKRSVHPDEQAAGSRYRCPVGVCRTKDKIWPRADNFRAHMKRVHQKDLTTDEDLDQYVHRPVPQPEEDLNLTQKDISPELHQFNTFSVEKPNYASNCWESSQSPVVGLPTEPSPAEDSSRLQVEVTHPLADKPAALPRSGMFDSATTPTVNDDGDDVISDKHKGIPRVLDVCPSEVLSKAEPIKSWQPQDNDSSSASEESKTELQGKGESPIDPQRMNESDEPRKRSAEPSSGDPAPSTESKASIDTNKAHASPQSDDQGLADATPITVNPKNRNEVMQLLEKLDSGGMLEALGWKKEDPPESDDTKQEPPNVSGRENHHACSECGKPFARRCELKKHEKRHAKPYGCTFQGCNKRFGSKNDWKRHENSQHFMLEHWRCGEKQTNNPSETCGKVYHRRELFKAHIEDEHHIKDHAALEARLDACRIGRNCEARFWCGFCQRIIEIKQKGLQAWTERFNHIDDHLNGRNHQAPMKIIDWKNEDPLHPGAESSTNDSNGSDVSSSPAPAADNTKNHRHARAEKLITDAVRIIDSARQKRKRDNRSDTHVSKRRHAVQDVPRVFCCQCREMMPVTSGQCIFCEHVLCQSCNQSDEPIWHGDEKS